MQFGAQINCYRTTWDKIHTVIQAMEAGSWDSLWFADHFLPPPPRREEEPLAAYEGFSLIAAAAAITERLRLGNMVLGNTYRNPALVAKMATTIESNFSWALDPQHRRGPGLNASMKHMAGTSHRCANAPTGWRKRAR